MIRYLIVALCMALSLTSCIGKRARFQEKQTQASLLEAWPIHCTAFSGASNLWLVTSEGDLLRTEDGGTNWNRISKETVGGFKQVSFINMQKGWAIDDFTQVWRTDDGGLTWEKISEIPARENFFVGSQENVYFIDELHGWIIDTTSIWRTEDGGFSWQRQIPSSDVAHSEQAFRYQFVNPEKAWLRGSLGVFYSTDDGGRTWREKKEPSKEWPEGIFVTDFFFVTDNIGWKAVISQDMRDDQLISSIHRTDDGGETWYSQEFPGKDMVINSIHFVDEMNGWAVGGYRREGASGDVRYKGIIIHTADGGKTWRFTDTSDNEEAYEQVHFDNLQNGWLIARRCIYRTDDGSKSWRKVLTL